MWWRIASVLGLTILPLAFGFVLGIIPGLLLGLPGWHRVAAIVLSILWAFGYVKQRGTNYRDVDWVTYSISFGGGIGLGVSTWFCGTLTD